MEPKDLYDLAQKVKSGTATLEEELALLKELNSGVETLREFIKEVMSSKK